MSDTLTVMHEDISVSYRSLLFLSFTHFIEINHLWETSGDDGDKATSSRRDSSTRHHSTVLTACCTIHHTTPLADGTLAWFTQHC